jgi:outer membrane receptor protein involved in Fe transport
MMLTAVSSRETTLDGTSSLPAYALCHGGFGYEARRYRFALGLRNLANSLYQEVPWFPQPGRQVHLSFHFKF